jgi:hypothetical protein
LSHGENRERSRREEIAKSLNWFSLCDFSSNDLSCHFPLEKSASNLKNTISLHSLTKRRWVYNKEIEGV